MLLSLTLVLAASDLSRFVYPLAKPLEAPPVVIDISDCPETKVWAEAAKALVIAWYPRVKELLATGGRDPFTGEKKGEAFRSPTEVKLVFKKTLNVPGRGLR